MTSLFFFFFIFFLLFIRCPTSYVMLLQVVPAISMLTRSVYSLHAPKNNIKAPPSETLTQAQAMDTLKEIGCRMQCMPHIPIPFRWFCACPVSYVIFSYSRIWGAPTVMCHRKYRFVQDMVCRLTPMPSKRKWRGFSKRKCDFYKCLFIFPDVLIFWYLLYQSYSIFFFYWHFLHGDEYK